MPDGCTQIALEWVEVGEAKWADIAEAHRERGEWNLSKRAADVADQLRYYRLAREASGV